MDSGNPEVEQRLSTAVGREVRLSRRSDLKPGATGEGYWPEEEWLADRGKTFDVELAPGSFFDGAMIHLLTSATLKQLGSLTPGSRFDVRRFRPNLLIESLNDHAEEGFVENGWIGKTLAIGDVRLRIDRGCPRCVMTTLPQEDLPKDPSVLRTAVQKNEGDVGVYATVLRGGRIKLGDEVGFD
jgi:uncharacterized protein YcbX